MYHTSRCGSKIQLDRLRKKTKSLSGYSLPMPKSNTFPGRSIPGKRIPVRKVQEVVWAPELVKLHMLLCRAPATCFLQRWEHPLPHLCVLEVSGPPPLSAGSRCIQSCLLNPIQSTAPNRQTNRESQFQSSTGTSGIGFTV